MARAPRPCRFGRLQYTLVSGVVGYLGCVYVTDPSPRVRTKVLLTWGEH